MSKRNNWEEFKKLLEQNNITKLYHFTDRDNLENIIKNGGLYSWKDCEDRGINIPKPGGGGPGSLSWSLDKRYRVFYQYLRLIERLFVGIEVEMLLCLDGLEVYLLEVVHCAANFCPISCGVAVGIARVLIVNHLGVDF
mgnify:CR=1 FL=1